MVIGAHGLPGHLATNNVVEEIKRGQDNVTTLSQLMVGESVQDLAAVVGAATRKLVLHPAQVLNLVKKR